MNLPWVPEVFLACGGNFRCWPKADTLTETGNRARKVSGTQGNLNRETDANNYVVQIARGKKKKTIEIVHNSVLSILLPISRFK